MRCWDRRGQDGTFTISRCEFDGKGGPQRLKPGCFNRGPFGTAEALPFPVGVTIKVKINTRVKSSGRGRPLYIVRDCF
jgi:hypothetical protein